MVNVGKFVELNIETAVHHRQYYQELDLQKDQYGSERKSVHLFHILMMKINGFSLFTIVGTNYRKNQCL